MVFLFFFNVVFFGTLYSINILHVITCCVVPPTSLKRAMVYKFPWGSTENMPRLMGITPHISLISKMGPVINKQGAIVKKVVHAVKL